MYDAGLFDLLPIWGVFIATLLIVLLSVEGGYQWARHKHRSEVEKEAPVGAMVGAILGLLAFILAFTFGMAANRYHDRKLALLDEANAIRATYWQAGMIPEPHRSEIRQILRKYIEERLQWAEGKQTNIDDMKNESLNKLETQVSLVGAGNPGGVDVFLGSVSTVVDLHAKRIMVRERSQIPTTFWIALYVIAVLSLASMGYHCGVAGTNRSPVSVAVAIAFSIVIMLISDLDRPGQGFINVSQQAMIDVRTWVNAQKP